MRLVILESPYAAPTPELVQQHVEYARACLRHSLYMGEAPIASHLLYTQPGVLNDLLPPERAMGIEAGLAWRHAAEASVVYTDLGITRGMQYGIDDALRHGRPIEYRVLVAHSYAINNSRVPRLGPAPSIFTDPFEVTG